MLLVFFSRSSQAGGVFRNVSLGCLIFFCCLLRAVDSKDRDVSVYYYPWYDLPTNTHWQEGFLRARLTPAMLPMLGKYSSRDGRVLQQHLAWSKQYGIDNWICSWWGPGSWEDGTLRQHVLPALAESTIKFCVYYEAGGLLGMNECEEIIFGAAAIDTLTTHVEHLAAHYFEHPNYQRIDGRPVLYIYLSSCFTGQFAEALQAARQVARRHGEDLFLVGDEIFWGAPNPERIQQMDAITAYCMHGPTDFEGYPKDSELLTHMSIKYNEYSQVAAQHEVAVKGFGGQIHSPLSLPLPTTALIDYIGPHGPHGRLSKITAEIGRGYRDRCSAAAYLLVL